MLKAISRIFWHVLKFDPTAATSVTNLAFYIPGVTQHNRIYFTVYFLKMTSQVISNRSIYMFLRWSPKLNRCSKLKPKNWSASKILSPKLYKVLLVKQRGVWPHKTANTDRCRSLVPHQPPYLRPIRWRGPRWPLLNTNREEANTNELNICII